MTGHARPYGLHTTHGSKSEFRHKSFLHGDPSGVCILGQPSSGKTLLMNTLLAGLETCKQENGAVVGRFIAHASSCAAELQRTFQCMVPLACGDLVPLPSAGQHLGAPKERFAILFIDDMHLAPM